jgi:hypothetical protein
LLTFLSFPSPAPFGIGAGYVARDVELNPEDNRKQDRLTIKRRDYWGLAPQPHLLLVRVQSMLAFACALFQPGQHVHPPWQ